MRHLCPQAAGLAVSASDDNLLRVWRLSDGACLQKFVGQHCRWFYIYFFYWFDFNVFSFGLVWFIT